MATKHETQIIRSMDEVPAGYEQLATLQMRVPGKKPLTVGKFLSEAHHSGKVPAVKLVRNFGDLKTGPVYLDRAKAIALLEAQYGVTVATSAAPATDDSTLREMRSLAAEMRDAVSAVQSLAADLRAAVELLAEQANDHHHNNGKEFSSNGVA